MDDTLRVFSPSSLNSGASVSSSGTGGLPKGLASTADGQLAFATTKDVQVLKLEAAKAPSKTASLGLTYNPTAIDCTAAGTRLVVAVGDDAGKVTLYDVDDGKLAQRAELKLNRSAVSALAFCPADQDLLAVGESSGKIILYVFDMRTPWPPAPLPSSFRSSRERPALFVQDQRRQERGRAFALGVPHRPDHNSQVVLERLTPRQWLCTPSFLRAQPRSRELINGCTARHQHLRLEQGQAHEQDFDQGAPALPVLHL